MTGRRTLSPYVSISSLLRIVAAAMNRTSATTAKGLDIAHLNVPHDPRRLKADRRKALDVSSNSALGQRMTRHRIQTLLARHHRNHRNQIQRTNPNRRDSRCDNSLRIWTTRNSRPCSTKLMKQIFEYWQEETIDSRLCNKIAHQL